MVKERGNATEINRAVQVVELGGRFLHNRPAVQISLTILKISFPHFKRKRKIEGAIGFVAMFR